jgi:hypothetical protein
MDNHATFESDTPNTPAVFANATSPGSTGVLGRGVGNGVAGQTNSNADAGVNGRNDGNGFGVFGFSQGGTGVQGHGTTGVAGFSTNGIGVLGRGATHGVAGQTNSNADAGVNGRNDGNGFGVFGFSQGGAGVQGHSTTGTGVVGFSTNGLAGRFIGNVEVTGDIRLVNADCAEDFDVAASALDAIEPGTVMVIEQETTLRPSQHAYDKRVAGVVSGAGNCQPGIVLDKQESQPNRMPIALMGKVYCKVDARYAPIEVGDLLTTSPTLGHAMKADDPFKAFGAVIGKALRPLQAGQGLIPILIALQ